MAAVRFNLNLKGSSCFPLVQNPVGYIRIVLKHRVQKQYRTSDEQTILFQDYTIVPQQRFPLIQIPVFSSFYCSLHLWYALHHLGLDEKLVDFLHQYIGKMSIDLSLRGLTGFNLLAQVEVVEIKEVEYDEQIEKWRKKEASRIMVEKLEKRQRRFMDVNEVKVGENCSVCLEEFEKERQLVSVIMMPCSHRFHRSCISRWLEEKNSCPMCRREIQALDLVS